MNPDSRINRNEPSNTFRSIIAFMRLNQPGSASNHPSGASSAGGLVTRLGSALIGDGTGHQNMMQLIQLRWIALAGQIMAIAIVHWLFDVNLPLKRMCGVLLCLAALNILSWLRYSQRSEVRNFELLISLLMDVAALTALLYLSGGATNPFVFLYPMQVTLGAILLQSWLTWSMVAVTILCFAGLTRFYVPLDLPQSTRDPFELHILGSLVCFILDAALLVIFMNRISRNLRARDARLADLRQQAAEEDHIVRMGLLASGAAHELSTPLSTLSVILGDWKRMPAFQGNYEILAEIEDMQAEVKRCKSIVTGILLSAGEARGESPTVTTVNQFMSTLVEEWCATRPVMEMDFENRFGADVSIVSDSALKQVICNVLDNALEASPKWISLEIDRQEEQLRLTVLDRGPGFAPELLGRIGKPYQSTKERPGSGLGLFLVVNVLRKLGGSVKAENRQEGGARVELRLPLAALVIEEEENGESPSPAADR